MTAVVTLPVSEGEAPPFDNFIIEVINYIRYDAYIFWVWFKYTHHSPLDKFILEKNVIRKFDKQITNL